MRTIPTRQLFPASDRVGTRQIQQFATPGAFNNTNGLDPEELPFTRCPMRRWIPTMCAALGALLLVGLAQRQDLGDNKEPDRSADQAAVRARTLEFLKALAKGDAAELAAFWTPTGEYLRGELTIRG